MKYKPIRNTDTYKKNFFAAANTGYGFVSFFDEIFGNLEKLFIIKGGPGTGKSSLMREVASEAENRGYSIQYFYCSTDPYSLDGIIIDELNTGIIDGTSPHTRDPKYPCVCEQIINVGEFWDENYLNLHKSEIISVISKKSELFKTAYGYLCATATTDDIQRALISPCILTSKLTAAVSRATLSLRNGSGYKSEIRMLDSISGNEHIYFDTFDKSASSVYKITNQYGIAYHILRAVIFEAKIKRQPIVVSYSPIDTQYEDGVYLPEADTAFIISHGNDISEDDKIINTARFIDNTTLKSIRNKLKACRKCRENLFREALINLDEARSLHTVLEKYYTSAMDFKRKENYTVQLIKKILSN